MPDASLLQGGGSTREPWASRCRMSLLGSVDGRFPANNRQRCDSTCFLAASSSGLSPGQTHTDSWGQVRRPGRRCSARTPSAGSLLVLGAHPLPSPGTIVTPWEPGRPPGVGRVLRRTTTWPLTCVCGTIAAHHGLCDGSRGAQLCSWRVDTNVTGRPLGVASPVLGSLEPHFIVCRCPLLGLLLYLPRR